MDQAEITDIVSLRTLANIPQNTFQQKKGQELLLMYISTKMNSHETMVRYGERNGNALQYSCLKIPVDGGAYWAAVHRVTHSWT